MKLKIDRYDVLSFVSVLSFSNYAYDYKNQIY